MTMGELIETLRALALRQRELASAFRTTGRAALANQHEGRAEAFEEAARMAVVAHYEEQVRRAEAAQ